MLKSKPFDPVEGFLYFKEHEQPFYAEGFEPNVEDLRVEQAVSFDLSLESTTLFVAFLLWNFIFRVAPGLIINPNQGIFASSHTYCQNVDLQKIDCLNGR